MDKDGKHVKQKERKAGGNNPAIVVLKPIKREDRAKLPPKVKVVFFCLMNLDYIPQEVYDDCLASHPEYFEPLKNQDEKET